MDNKEIVEILKGLAKPGAGYRTIWALNIAMAFFSDNEELPLDLDQYSRGWRDGWAACNREHNIQDIVDGGLINGE